MRIAASLVSFILILLLIRTGSLSAQPVKASVRADGSFDITGTSIKITNCYPALDNRSLKAISVKVDDKGNTKTIQYHLQDETMELQFGYEEGALSINIMVTGQTVIPEWISLLRDADVTGASKVYKTSSQIMGNGGIKDWPKNKGDNLSCSNITGLVPDTGSTMVISTRNYKKYNSYTNAYLGQGKKN